MVKLPLAIKYLLNNNFLLFFIFFKFYFYKLIFIDFQFLINII